MPVSSPRTRSLACFVALVLLLAATAARAKEPPLAAYNAPIDQTSVSGISSGAYMAVQFATAWSSIVHGVGAVAGGPYGCAEGSASAALSSCMLGTPPIDLEALIRHTDAWSAQGAIDPVGDIARQKVYLFSGYNDTVVARGVVNELRDFYAHYLGAAHRHNLFYQTAIGAGHAQVTVSYGGGCAANGGDYINHCGYDQAGIILQQIYGALHPPNTGSLSGQVLRFDQGDYTRPYTPLDDSMGSAGFVYVPRNCAALQACRVHVVLHGCKQSYEAIGETFVRHAGYNAWADTNNIIVLYPQARAEAITITGGSNPEGCWDWWGYLDTDPMDTPTYLLKSGRQIAAIKAMLDRLTSGARPESPPVADLAQPPAALVAADASASAIDLVWSAVPGAARYAVFRSSPGDTAFQQIGTTAGLSYADTDLRPDTTYRYKVRAAQPGQGPFSPVATRATRRWPTPCAMPGNCP